MRYLVWGTGAYCQDKIQYNFQKTEDEVLCFIDRKKGCFWGKEVILPSEILQYQFDKIAIFSSHFLEIAKELIQMGIKSEHIIPGIVFSPYRGSEIQFMTDISSVNVMENGNLDYKYKDKHITIACDKDWIKVKEMFCSEENVELVKNININPVSRLFGIDRGTPIDRYYIESFLKNNSEHIKGNVLEMGEDKYTQQYGDKNCNSFVFMFGEEKGVEGGFVYGDLEKGENLPKEFFDCIIFTQVFNFIYDVSTAIANSIKMLKKGGIMLITVAGNTPISRYDMDRWGHYWNFTYKSIEKLCSFDNTECDVFSYGNCKTACAFLQGMSVCDLPGGGYELNHNDSDYPVVICASVRKL